LKKTNSHLESSFRDPCGFIFKENSRLYRQVNKIYIDDYRYLMDSGLYEDLTSKGLLIPHKEAMIKAPAPELSYKIIEPEYVSEISYPYEWSFSQIKDAALLSLRIQNEALKKGMTLKDCSAYNVQFIGCKPIFIDTLSFNKYNEGSPWVAYRQFCQHFLAPLVLMAYRDVRLNQLMRIYIDGIPIDLTSLLLPKRSYLNFSVLSHIHLHARSQKRYENRPSARSAYHVKKQSLLYLIKSLSRCIKKLRIKTTGTEWAEYYNNTNYSEQAFNEKKKIISNFINEIKPDKVWDIGGNRGHFSRIASSKGIYTVCFDVDPLAVERNYLNCLKEKSTNLLPLVLDLTNPSSGIGWANVERESFTSRAPVHTAFALALIHHLSISNNVPFDDIAQLCHRICQYLIIEFVPKEDSKVKILLATRKDIFPDYNKSSFERSFKKYFYLIKSIDIKDSLRTLYLFRKK
jgi:hypothetical protein